MYLLDHLFEMCDHGDNGLEILMEYIPEKENVEEKVNFFYQEEDGIRDRNVTGVQTCALPIYKARTLNVFHLGDDVAAGLGTSVERERLVLLLLAVALAGAGVAAGGAIAFIGLVVPHIARKLIGLLHQYIIPLATLIGAVLLLSANLIGKNLLAPTSIPAGIVVSLVSAPYFIYLLIKVK